MNRKTGKINLEKFPDIATAQEMLGMVTKGWYDNSYVGKWLFQVMGMEMEDARRFFEELRQQIFPETATWGLVYHEQKYGISTNTNLDLATRRNEIIKARDSKLPLNPARLEEIILQNYKRNVVITENVRDYFFMITLASGNNEVNYENLAAYVDKMKPAHISYYISFEQVNNITILPSFAIRKLEYIRAGEGRAGMFPGTGIFY